MHQFNFNYHWNKAQVLYTLNFAKEILNVSSNYLIYLSLKVFLEYFKELEEESIRDNFVIIYELLDELMDFGYPQTTDSKILQEWLTP